MKKIHGCLVEVKGLNETEIKKRMADCYNINEIIHAIYDAEIIVRGNTIEARFEKSIIVTDDHDLSSTQYTGLIWEHINE
jgi:hypothetical protein